MGEPFLVWIFTGALVLYWLVVFACLLCRKEEEVVPRLRYKITDGYVVCCLDNVNQMLVDLSDFELVSKYSWYVDSAGYPATRHKGQRIRLHKMLLGKLPQGLVVDHINRSKLDNRRSNLRVCTQQINMQNMSLKSTNKSGVTGVFFDKQVQRWRAQISSNGKTKHVGIFDDFEDAVNARKKAEKIYYTERV